MYCKTCVGPTATLLSPFYVTDTQPCTWVFQSYSPAGIGKVGRKRPTETSRDAKAAKQAKGPDLSSKPKRKRRPTGISRDTKAAKQAKGADDSSTFASAEQTPSSQPKAQVGTSHEASKVGGQRERVPDTASQLAQPHCAANVYAGPLPSFPSATQPSVHVETIPKHVQVRSPTYVQDTVARAGPVPTNTHTHTVGRVGLSQHQVLAIAHMNVAAKHSQDHEDEDSSTKAISPQHPLQLPVPSAASMATEAATADAASSQNDSQCSMAENSCEYTIQETFHSTQVPGPMPVLAPTQALTTIEQAVLQLQPTATSAVVPTTAATRSDVLQVWQSRVTTTSLLK